MVRKHLSSININGNKIYIIRIVDMDSGKVFIGKGENTLEADEAASTKYFDYFGYRIEIDFTTKDKKAVITKKVRCKKKEAIFDIDLLDEF